MPPFGRMREPPHGPGLELPTYSRPSGASDGGYHAPPPPADGYRHASRIVSNRQRMRPVRASRAYSAPRPPGAKPTVDVTTSPCTASGAIEMNCSVRLTSFRVQSTSPFRRSSANAVESVAPNTRFPESASPFGPSFGARNRRIQRSAPVRTSGASPLELGSCAYTGRGAMGGVDANAPNVEPWRSGNRQRTRRFATVRDVIGEAPTDRVPARPAFGC